MENINEFVNSSLVEVSQIEDTEQYGHYPFSMFAETEDGKHEINALALGGDVMACYQRVKQYLNANAKRVYMSLDFPASGNIKNDFIGVFQFENDDIKVFAIPYDIETGEKFEIIEDDLVLDIIKSQFQAIV